MVRTGEKDSLSAARTLLFRYLRGDIHEAVARPNGTAIPLHRDGYHDVDALIRKQQKTERIDRAGLDPLQRARRLTDPGIREAHRYGWNDTYTFTKWLGEQLALRGMQERTLTIVRPSMIESTLQEPAAGWIEGAKVADAIILAYARGKTRFFPAMPKEIIDIIPADLVANSILLATAEAMKERRRHRIYQCCSGSSNPVRPGDVIRLQQMRRRATGSDTITCFIASRRTTFALCMIAPSGWCWARCGLVQPQEVSYRSCSARAANRRRWRPYVPRACWP